MRTEENFKNGRPRIKSNPSGDTKLISNPLLEAVFQNPPSGIILIDGDLIIRKVNPYFIEMSGYSNSQIEGKSAADFIPVSSKDTFISNLKTEEKKFEIDFIFNGGRSKRVEIKSFNAEEKPGPADARILFIREINSGSKDNYEINKIEEIFPLLIGSSSFFYFPVDKDGIINLNGVIENYKFSKIFNQNINGIKFRDLFEGNKIKLPDGKLVYINDIIDRAFNGILVSGEIKINTSFYKINIIPGPVNGSAVSGITCIFADLNKTKISKESYLDDHEFLLNILQNNIDLISVLSAEGIILYGSPSVINITGYNQGELYGKSAFDYIHPDDYSKVKQIIKSVITDKGSIQKVEFRFRRKNSSWLYLESTGKSLEDTDGNSIILINSRDVTERRRIERELIESRERYQILIDNQSDLVVKVDPDGNFMFVSKSYCEMFGKSSEELLGKKFIPLVHDDDKAKTLEEFARVFAPPYTAYIEQRAMTRYGWRWLAWSDKAVVDKNGKVAAIVGVGRDISEKKVIEEKLRESEQRFRLLIEKAPVGIVMFRHGKIIFFNTEFMRLFGYSDFTEINDSPIDRFINFNNFIVRKDKRLSDDSIREVLSSFEEEGIKKDRTMINISVYSANIDMADGPATIAFIADISLRIKTEKELETHRNNLEQLVNERTTELQKLNKRLSREIKKQKLSEEKIQNQLKFLRSLIDTIPDPVYIKDINKKYVDCNTAFEKYFCLDKDKIIGGTVLTLFPESEAEKHDATDDKLLNGHDKIVVESKHKSKTGEEAAIMVSKASFTKADGTINGIVGVIIDITDQRKLEEKTKRALEKEKDLNELKTRFISIASHEFRTPLTSIRIFSELLEMRHAFEPEKISNYAARIKHSVDHMTDLINDVLTVSRADSGKLQFKPKMSNLYTFIKLICTEFEPFITSEHKFVWVYESEIPEAFVDEKLLKLALMNLLSNAVKYSPDGGQISLKVFFKDADLFIKVSDEGIGIPEKEQKDLFKEFHRGSNTGTIQGTGLGLSIVKKCVDLHGGKITYKNGKNRGSIFTIILPYKKLNE